MNRRDAIRLSAGALLSFGLWPGRLRAQDNGHGDSGWTFIAVNDLHYEDAACGPWFAKIGAAMKASAPDAEFCLLGGDQANSGTREQLGAIRELFTPLGIPIHATPGNHDYVTDHDRTAYDAMFPGQLNQSFEHRGWQIVGLDSTQGTAFNGTEIQPATLGWLEENLPRLDRAKPTILWTHFPLGAGVRYRPRNADALLDRLREFNLAAAFSGHWHGFTERRLRRATLTTGRCCARIRGNHDGTPEKGWFVCTAKDGAVTRRFVQIPEPLRAPARPSFSQV